MYTCIYVWLLTLPYFPSPLEIELLSQHGTMLPANMQGLTEEQVQELKLRDEWAERCVPSGGAVVNPDPTRRRNGQGDLHVHILVSELRDSTYG